jgi:hypothetical protein
LNSDRARKLRPDEWLISAILLQINQLADFPGASRQLPRSVKLSTNLLPSEMEE